MKIIWENKAFNGYRWRTFPEDNVVYYRRASLNG